MPVGIPIPGATAVTVAVNVIEAPTLAGLSDEVIVDRLAAWLTVCEKAGETLPGSWRRRYSRR